MTADHDRLRAALAAAATAAPVPPAWDAIAERVAAGEVVALPPVRRRAPALAAAAAVVFLALAGVGIAVGRDDRDDVTATGGSEAYCAVLARPARADVGPQVHVFLDPAVTPEQVEAVRAAIRAEAPADGYAYVESAAAYEEAQEMFEDQETLRDLLRPEDVPPRFVVISDDEDAAEAFVARVADAPGVIDADIVPVPEPQADADLFTVMAGIARGGPRPEELGFLPVSDDVLEAFRATAPAELGRSVVSTAHILRDLGPPSRLAREAVDTVVADAVERCGREVPPAPEGGAPDTTAATTTTEPG
ncbi:MAG TPA: permease-like cell division protein FtsX [Iamia sp.]|nr:permease-like cell division protein FtsX [Iamia sp.]